VRLQPDQPIVQRYIATLSATSVGHPVTAPVPARLVLFEHRLVGILLGGGEEQTANGCFCVELADICQITLEREVKRFGRHRDGALRVIGRGPREFEICIDGAAVETTTPATYGPPPTPVPLLEVLRLMAGTAAASIRPLRKPNDPWLAAVERGQTFEVGGDLIFYLSDPMSA